MDKRPEIRRTARSTRKKQHNKKSEITVIENTVKFAPIFNGKLVSNKASNQMKDIMKLHQPKRSYQGIHHQSKSNMIHLNR